MKNKIPNPPSEEFEIAVRSSASGLEYCECGRVHFSPGDGFDWEDGELERLEKKAKKNPDKYVDHGDCAIERGMIGENNYVLGCRCNQLKPYEDFIWEHRHIIEKYLRLKAKKILGEAKEEKDISDSVSKSTKEME